MFKPKQRSKSADTRLSSQLFWPLALRAIHFWLRGIALLVGALLQPTQAIAISLPSGVEKIEIPALPANLESILKPVPAPSESRKNNPNLIPNPSAEALQPGSSTLPSGGWKGVVNGTSSVSFDLVKPGHTGSRAFNVTVKTFSGGDAFWFYPPQPVTAGKTYEFSDTYITDTNTTVWLHLTYKDGTEKVTWFGDAYSSPDWNHFYGQFKVPDNVVSAGVYHSISSKGYLITDDYRLNEYSPLALHRPLVTLSFDDGFDPVYTNGLPLFQKYGVVTTQFIPTGFIDQQGRFTRSMVQSFAHSGHEIGSHTVTHPFLTSLSKAQVDQELMQSQQEIFTITGIRPTSLATPYGAYSSTVTQESSNYYRAMRNVNVGFNSRENADAFDIKVQDITATTTINDISTWLAKSKADKTWLVLVYHNLSADQANAGLYNTPPDEFEKHLQLIKASGITILPMNQAVAELKAQSIR